MPNDGNIECYQCLSRLDLRVVRSTSPSDAFIKRRPAKWMLACVEFYAELHPLKSEYSCISRSGQNLQRRMSRDSSK